MRLEKQYPNYELIRDDGKRIKVVLSENKESYEVIGVSGKKIKCGKKTLTDNSCWFLSKLINYYNDDSYHDYLDLYEKIMSLSNVPYSFKFSEWYFDKLKVFSMKDIAKAFSETNIDILDADKLIHEIIKSQTKRVLTNEQIQFFDYISDRLGNSVMEKIKTNKKYRTIFFKVMSTPIAEAFGYFVTLGIIDEYFDYCEKLEQPPETGNFFVNYKKAKAEYEARKEELEEKKFKETQVKYSLNFEDDEFFIVVPTTRKELIEEGHVLNNCLGGHEFTTYLADGFRGVVFIRRKDEPNKSYIACDFDAKTLEIQQYLTYNNDYVRETDAKAFKEKYQEYLYSLLGKTDE